MQAQDRPGHLLSLKNIRKTFGGIRALKGVSLSLDEGEVLALVGENGAGKSTLVKVLTGIYHPEEGQINVRGSELIFEDAHAAGRAGIAAVHQETVMFDELSVAENIYMGRQPMKKGVIDWATMNSQAQVILDEIGAPFKSDVLVKSLGPAERHLVEISRALSQEARVVILDEPTAALSRQEINDFYGIVRRLRDQGKGIIFITHKFDEIFSLADRYLVLRDGASVGEGRIADATEDSLVSLMVGRDLEHVARSRQLHAAHGSDGLRQAGDQGGVDRDHHQTHRRCLQQHVAGVLNGGHQMRTSSSTRPASQSGRRPITCPALPAARPQRGAVRVTA